MKKLKINKSAKHVQASIVILFLMLFMGWALYNAPAPAEKNFVTGFTVSEEQQVIINTKLTPTESTETANAILVDVINKEPSNRSVYALDGNGNKDLTGQVGLSVITGFATLAKCEVSGKNAGVVDVNLKLGGASVVKTKVCFVQTTDEDGVTVSQIYVPLQKGGFETPSQLSYIQVLDAEGKPRFDSGGNQIIRNIKINGDSERLDGDTLTSEIKGYFSGGDTSVPPPKPSAGVPLVPGSGGSTKPTSWTTEGPRSLEPINVQTTPFTEEGDQLTGTYKLVKAVGPDGREVNLRRHYTTVEEVFYTDEHNALLPNDAVYKFLEDGDATFHKYNHKKGNFGGGKTNQVAYEAQLKDAEFVSRYRDYMNTVALTNTANNFDPTGQFPGHYLTGPVKSADGTSTQFAFVNDNLISSDTIYELKYNSQTGKYEKVKCNDCSVDKQGDNYVVKKGQQVFNLQSKESPTDSANKAIAGCEGKFRTLANGKPNPGYSSSCDFVEQSMQNSYRVYSAKFRSIIAGLFNPALENAAWFQKTKKLPSLMCAVSNNVRMHDNGGGLSVPINYQWNTDVDAPIFGPATTDEHIGGELVELQARDPFAEMRIYKIFYPQREEITPTLYRYSFFLSLTGSFSYDAYLVNSCTKEESKDIEGGFRYQGQSSANGVDRQRFADDSMLFNCAEGPCRFNYVCVDFYLTAQTAAPDGRICQALSSGKNGEKFFTFNQKEEDAGGTGNLPLADCGQNGKDDVVKNKKLDVPTLCSITSSPKEYGLQGCD